MAATSTAEAASKGLGERRGLRVRGRRMRRGSAAEVGPGSLVAWPEAIAVAAAAGDQPLSESLRMIERGGDRRVVVQPVTPRCAGA